MEAMTIKAAAAALVAGAVMAALLWPTSNCVSTLKAAAVPGQPDPNTRTCMSVVGLPAHSVVAVVVALVMGAAVYVLVRRRASTRAGDGG